MVLKLEPELSHRKTIFYARNFLRFEMLIAKVSILIKQYITRIVYFDEMVLGYFKIGYVDYKGVQ